MALVDDRRDEEGPHGAPLRLDPLRGAAAAREDDGKGGAGQLVVQLRVAHAQLRRPVGRRDGEARAEALKGEQRDLLRARVQEGDARVGQGHAQLEGQQ